MCNSLIRLLTWMQLVIPEEVAQSNAGLAGTVGSCDVAQVVRYVHNGGRVQVPCRIVVDVCHEGVDVKDCDRGTGIPLCDQEFEWCSVVEDVIHQLGVFFHLAAYLGGVCWLEVSSVIGFKLMRNSNYLIRPVMADCQPFSVRHSIKR